MDSGNSGSMNSSSGDEEYESRTDHSNLPSFLNPSLSTHFGSSDSNPPDPSHLLSHHHLFDLQPNNFLLNLDTSVRSRSPLMRSDQHQHQQPYHLGRMNNNNNPHTSSLSNIQQPLMFPSSSSSIQLQPSQLPNEMVTTTTTTTSAAAATTASTTAALRSGGGSSSQTAPVLRSSKKRTRASRRAPTTVLTTDTSNFRAMVQEFTGIPAPPFSASSPFSRRLDLFGSGSSGIRSGGGVGAHLDGPLYPLVRPSAIKPPFSTVPSSLSSSSMLSNVMVDATNIATSSLNYPPPSSSSSDHHHLLINKQPMRHMLNMHNQNQSLNMAFQLQSLPLHSTPTNALNVAAAFGAAKQPHDQEMNVAHGYGGAASSASLPEAPAPPIRRDEMWRVEGGAAAGSASGDINCKMNYVAAAAPPNSAEINASSRGEGTVDSWIFPSD